MNAFVNAVGPVIGKLVLGYFFGSTVSTIGGTILNMSAKRFADMQTARKAASFAEEFGNSVAKKIDASLIGEGADNDERAVVGRELSSMLDQAPLSNLIVSSNMNTEKLKTSLESIGNPIGLNSREIGFYQFAIRATASHLRNLGPSLEGYDVERDEVVLTALEKIAVNSEKLAQGQKEFESVLSDFMSEIDVLISDEQRKFDAYENDYISKISELLNYVEVLGLDDIKRDRRESNLEVAYLSLSLSGSNKLPSDFASFLYHIIQSNGRAIIQGGAGSGKSTLMRWAATKAMQINDYKPRILIRRGFAMKPKIISNIEVNFNKIIEGILHKSEELIISKTARKTSVTPVEMESGSFSVITHPLVKSEFF